MPFTMRQAALISFALPLAFCGNHVPPVIAPMDSPDPLLDFLQNSDPTQMKLKPGGNFFRSMDELNITVAHFLDKNWRIVHGLDDPRVKLDDPLREKARPKTGINKLADAELNPPEEKNPEPHAFFGQIPEDENFDNGNKGDDADKGNDNDVSDSDDKGNDNDKDTRSMRRTGIFRRRTKLLDIDGKRIPQVPVEWRPWRWSLTHRNPIQPQCWRNENRRYDANYGGVRLCYDFLMYHHSQLLTTEQNQRDFICEAEYYGRRTIILGQLIRNRWIGRGSSWAAGRGLEWVMLSCPRIDHCFHRLCPVGGMNSMWDNGEYTVVIVGHDLDEDIDI